MADTTIQGLFPSDAPSQRPRASDPERASLGFEMLEQAIDSDHEDAEAERLRALCNRAPVRNLLNVVFSNSPFLTKCLVAETGLFASIVADGPDGVLGQVLAGLKRDAMAEQERDVVKAGLRRARRQVALTIALADITGLWSLDQVTEGLTSFADHALSCALSTLLLRALSREELILPDPEHPERDCGYMVLAMGKYGARELNYSSDIDLIVLFDPEKAQYVGSRGPHDGFVRLTRDLVNLLDDHTKDGYVFRTDLRLRPDPGAMPLAISYNSAMAYYESMGQNWERAAMIKARAVAGDQALGRAFLQELRPFVWRKHLDFWAIQDVHSIKRQIHVHKGGGKIAMAGHNIKLGRGGIREIEFFAQTQQLIYGGRFPDLRPARTKEALAALAAAKRIDQATADDLSRCYDELRRIEHRLQMIDDHQTHSLPESDDELAALAGFLGYESLSAFREALFELLQQVEQAYAALFEEAPTLARQGNLVFTGSEPGSETLATLHELGFADGAKVFHLVRAWHHGRYRATRSTRARELLTELMPSLLEALAKTASPDTAVAKFDEFLGGLPAGVQLFSLIHANPWLLDFLSEIMGGAPALADALSRKPNLLDGVLSLDFFDALPPRDVLVEELDAVLAHAKDFQDVLDLTRRWTNDHRFQAGAHILRRSVEIEASGQALADLAEAVVLRLQSSVQEELAKRHGQVEGPGLAVLALGKLGGREMTLTSDLDLIFLYQAEEGCEASDGTKPLAVSQYYGRLAQRFINALSAPTGEGRLYEIDMRLRPSGSSGPIAVSYKSFDHYQMNEAWTWEHMALTRARLVTGEASLRTAIEATIRNALTQRRDPEQLVLDVAKMRAKIASERKAFSLWNVKYIRGGLIDLDFLAQYLILANAHDKPAVLHRTSQGAFRRLAAAGVLGTSLAGDLIEGTRLMHQVQSYLRLSAGDSFDEATAPESLRAGLAAVTGSDDFDQVRDRLIRAAQIAAEVYDSLIAGPAAALSAEISQK